LCASHGGAGNVADGVDAGLAGARRSSSVTTWRPVDLHLGTLEADPLDVADDADGR
jgi:hypothetical protein